MSADEPTPIVVATDGPTLRGERSGEGPAIVLCHGLTATRRYVVHGSKLLARRGHQLILYDARGHGESDPAPEGSGYGYPELVADLDAMLTQTVGAGPLVLGGHSMGAHTALAYALENPERVTGLVIVCPAYTGPASEEVLDYWDGLAEALERGGAAGFVEAIEAAGVDPAWRETVLRITRERISLHRHPEALALALREVPRSQPFETISDLETLEVPVLVVASHDVADPGHPYAVAEAYAERMPEARLISEAEGESPLAWQGGRLSREIAEFCAGLGY
ncbi:MAG: alpha/beta fold hydrolase [Solirubrobacterales bacterium]